MDGKRSIDVVLQAVGGQEELNKIYKKFWPKDGLVAYEKTSYDDEFSQEEVQNILDKYRELQRTNDPALLGRTFAEFLIDDINDRKYSDFNLGENEIYHKDYLVGEIVDFLESQKDIESSHSLRNEIAENLSEQGFSIEYYFNKSILPEKVCVDLGFQTNEEANHDACLIHDCIEELNYGRGEYDFESFDNALVYLIYSQGYTLADVLNNKTTDSVFLNTLREEMNNSFNVCNELTVCAELDLEDWCSIVDGNANIKLTPQNNNLGIYAHYDGGGSLLGIHLEKDVVMPAEFCGKAERFYRVGDCDLAVGQLCIKNVYGVSNDFYQPCEITNEPASLSVEDFQNKIKDDVQKLNEKAQEKRSSKAVAKEAKESALGASGKSSGRDSEER